MKNETLLQKVWAGLKSLVVSAIKCYSNALKQGTKCYQVCKCNRIGLTEMSILASTL